MVAGSRRIPWVLAARPSDVDTPYRAEAALLMCRPDLAATALDGLDTIEATAGPALEARLIYDRAFGTEVDPATLVLMSLWNTSLARQAEGSVEGDSPFRDYQADVQVYGRIPLTPPGPTFPTGASGLSAWLQDPIAAADVGAPGSPLAECR
jgi:hypothetical protein